VALLVRAQHDRWVRVAPEAPQSSHGLWATLGAAPSAGERPVPVPRRPGQRARTATLPVRGQAVVLVPPPHKQQLPPVPVWAIRPTEHAPPPDVEPLDWLLLTTLPVTSFAAAQARLAWSVCRWTSEVWHSVLTAGCARARRPLARAETRQRGLALACVIAWRVRAAPLLARAVPDLPCTVLLEAAEGQARACAIPATSAPPAAPPSLGAAVRWRATLGGDMGRRREGPPGPEVLWRGLRRLVDRTLM
jgi:hypothetical protein